MKEILSTVLSLALFGLVLSSAPSCRHAPPTLSQPAAAAFEKTRVIKGLDLLRDFAIDAEAASPQVLPTATTRKIVQAHQSILRIMDAAGAGWQAIVATTLDEVVNSLPAGDKGKVAPYVALVKTLLQEVH
jgi:hypothetical protein